MTFALIFVNFTNFYRAGKRSDSQEQSHLQLHKFTLKCHHIIAGLSGKREWRKASQIYNVFSWSSIFSVNEFIAQHHRCIIIARLTASHHNADRQPYGSSLTHVKASRWQCIKGLHQSHKTAVESRLDANRNAVQQRRTQSDAGGFESEGRRDSVVMSNDAVEFACGCVVGCQHSTVEWS